MSSPADLLIEATKDCGMLDMVIAFAEVRTMIALLKKEITDMENSMNCPSLVLFKDRLEMFSTWIMSRLKDDLPYETPPGPNALTAAHHDEIRAFLKGLVTKATTWNECLNLYKQVDAASELCFILAARLQFWEECQDMGIMLQQSLANLKKP